jgi:methylenetetrahydrofolate--tRNA-(uracil-5-)-methyltransferase
MNINFGLFPPHEGPLLDAEGKKVKGKAKGLARKQALARRALEDCDRWAAAVEQASVPQAAE